MVKEDFEARLARIEAKSQAAHGAKTHPNTPSEAGKSGRAPKPLKAHRHPSVRGTIAALAAVFLRRLAFGVALFLLVPPALSAFALYKHDERAAQFEQASGERMGDYEPAFTAANILAGFSPSNMLASLKSIPVLIGLETGPVNHQIASPWANDPIHSKRIAEDTAGDGLGAMARFPVLGQ